MPLVFLDKVVADVEMKEFDVVRDCENGDKDSEPCSESDF